MFAVACSAPRPESIAPCAQRAGTELVIRWGTENDSLNKAEVYSVSTKGEIFKHVGPIIGTDPTSYIGFADHETYCSVAGAVRDAFLKTQALNTRGTKARFIEYRNERTDVYLRAVWNPDLSTFQSRDMREQYDALMAIVPK